MQLYIIIHLQFIMRACIRVHIHANIRTYTRIYARCIRTVQSSQAQASQRFPASVREAPSLARVSWSVLLSHPISSPGQACPPCPPACALL